MCSPFSPIDRLSQSQHGPMNPILSHLKEVWTRIHKMLKIPHLRQPYSAKWHNPTIIIGQTPIYWKKWHLSGICRVDDLYQSCVFMSYTDLTRRYALTGNGHFWKYLQIRSCLAQGAQYMERNPITDFLRLPTEHLKASIFYRLTNELSNSCDSLRGVWQKDLGCILNEEEWLNILSHTGEFVRESRSKFT